MESINILRLKTGEDIICYVEDYGNDIIVREPMTVFVKNDYKSGKQMLGMEHWLPRQLVRNNEAFMKKEDVLAFLNPSVEFTEYYENTVSVINQLKNSMEESELESTSSNDDVLSQEDMSLILESLDTSNIKVVH